MANLTQSRFEDVRADEARQRDRAVKTIASAALGVSLLYVLVYGLMGLKVLTVYSAFFAACYVGILGWRKPTHLGVRGIILIGCGLVHVGGIAMFFVPPGAGTHTFLMVIPLFSLIAIQSKDRFWWWAYTVISVGLVAYFEWVRDTLVPPFALSMEASEYQPWRAVAAIITLFLIFFCCCFS